MNQYSELGFIAMPGARSSAYLQVFKKLGYAPACVIQLQNQHAANASAFLQSHSLAARYIDAALNEQSFCSDANIPLFATECTDINDLGLQQLLLSTGIKTWLFSGGGIIKPALFQTGLQFLHIHPGRLPQVRGSTCFYYSLLHDNSLAATAFFMTADLDAGTPLQIEHFAVNLAAPLLSTGFIDYVIDPWIRAETLSSLLQHWSSAGFASINPSPTPALINGPSRRPCYVIHPLLRALTVQQLSRRFNPELPQGVYRLDTK